MIDNETIFNIIINYSQCSFEIYDDDHICYINNSINPLVSEKNMILGI